VGVGEVRSTNEAGQCRGREGTSLLGASYEAKDTEIGVSLTTPDGVRRLQRKLYIKAKEAPQYRFYLLYDKVHREDILQHAYRVSRAQGGAPGVDGETFTHIDAQGREAWVAALRKELQAQTYRPAPVRRVLIPKPDGGERPLGIPTIRDRVVQTAVKLVLEPIFEADFDDSAFGYRPRRSAQDAVQTVHRALCDGYTEVVDADLSKYFDTIPHQELLQCVARRVVDGAMLHLIKMWLKAPIEERDGQDRRRMTGGRRSTRGTPQGGVLSPLLANIYMHRFLRAWRQRGKDEAYCARLINYADDFVILSRGHAAVALAWTRWAMTHIGLALNETKTCLRNAREESFTFLGYDFGPARYRTDGHWYLAAKPAQKSVAHVKHAIGRVLQSGNQAPWPEVVARLNRMLEGWANYFNYGTRSTAYQAVNRYVADAVRRFLSRRHKVRSRGTRRFAPVHVFGSFGVTWLRTRRPGAVSVSVM
jgi:RNA-directed DNA polymerase